MRYILISALWCPACIITNNAMDKIIEEKHIDLTRLDYDFDDIEKYNVGRTLPVIIVFNNDIEVGRIIGEKNYNELIKEINKYEENN